MTTSIGSVKELNDVVWPVYEALWTLASKDIHVTYNGLLDGEEAGRFSAREDEPGRGPHIDIFRKRYRAPSFKPSRTFSCGDEANIWGELFTLAHEYGHYLSHKSGLRTTDVIAASNALFERRSCSGAGGPVPGERLSEAQHDLVRQEEIRAWKHGREVLARLKELDGFPFDFWAAFDECERWSLGIYEEIFDRDAQGWPKEAG